MKKSPFAAQSGILSTRYEIGLVLIISFILKSLIRIMLIENHNYWETGYDFYYKIARNFVTSGSYYLSPGDQTFYLADKLYAIRTPLYPLLIAAIGALTEFSAPLFIILQAAISTITVWLVYLISRTLSTAKGALLAAILCAFYPYSVFHDTQLQENALYNCVSLASVWYLLLAYRTKKAGHFAWAGFFLGLATLTRASHLVHTMFLAIWIFWTLRQTFKKAALGFCILICTFTLCLSPWLIRNKIRLGAFTLTSMTGPSLLIAHNKSTFLFYPYKGSIDKSTQQLVFDLKNSGTLDQMRIAGKNELVQSQKFKEMALAYILGHKLETLKRGIYKTAVNFLGVLSPLKEWWENIAYFLSYWTLTLLSIFSFHKTRRTPFFQIFILLCVSQAIFSFVFFAHSSHRSFLDPMLAVFAGIGLSQLLARASIGQVGRKK